MIKIAYSFSSCVTGDSVDYLDWHSTNRPFRSVTGYPKTVDQVFSGQPSPIQAADRDIATDIAYILQGGFIREYSMPPGFTLNTNLLRQYLLDSTVDNPFFNMPPDVTTFHTSSRTNTLYAFVGEKLHVRDWSNSNALWKYKGQLICG